MNSVIIVDVRYPELPRKVSAQIKYCESGFPEHGREYGYVIAALKKAALQHRLNSNLSVIGKQLHAWTLRGARRAHKSRARLR